MIKEFLTRLEHQHFSLVVEGDRLTLKADRRKLSAAAIHEMLHDEDIISFIRNHKDALISYLASPAGEVSAEREDNIEGMCKLSSLQEGMLFQTLYDEGQLAYLNQLCLAISQLDKAVFLKAWNLLLQRHGILRSGFHFDAFRVPVQCVYRKVEIPVREIDLRALDEATQTAEIEAVRKADMQTPFDLKTAPLMRLILLRRHDNDYTVIWTHHHLIMDGWSGPVLMKEFLELYDVLAAGQEPAEVPEDRYEDYIRYIGAKNKEAEEVFWKTQLRHLSDPTLLPFLHNHEAANKTVQSFEAVLLELDETTTEGIRQFAQVHHLTVNIVMQGVWAYLLSYYTGNSHVVFGATVSGRPSAIPNVEQRVGLYINTLPHTVEVNPDDTIIDWLQKIQAGQRAMEPWQHSALGDIQRLISMPGVLFDSLVTFQNYPVSEMIQSHQWALQVTAVKIEEPTTNYPLSIRIITGNRIVIQFIYQDRLLPATYMAMIRAHFNQVLQAVVNDAVLVKDINPLTPSEEIAISDQSNATRAADSVSFSLAAEMDDLLLLNSGKTAIRYRNHDTSYDVLYQRINRLGQYIREEHQLKPGDRVLVLLERSEWTMVALLTTLRNGWVYVPVDTSNPLSRVEFIAADTEAALIITNDSLADCWPDAQRVLTLSRLEAIVATGVSAPVKLEIPSSHPAYIIYTSGSTGLPKGVVISHDNLNHFLYNISREYSFREPVVMPFIASPAFDISLFQLLLPLINGGISLIVDVAQQQELSEFIAELQQATVIDTVPGVYRLLADQMKGTLHQQVERLFIGGDKVPDNLLPALSEIFPSAEIVVTYGPTEATIFCTTARYGVGAISNVSGAIIGTPLGDAAVFILSPEGKLLPPGIVGEICIGGGGVGQYYLNQPALTNKHFVDTTLWGVSRLYRTGDRGSRTPDGNIRFCGRIDNQVKIRGYRIEINEIEFLLVKAPGVKAAVVTVHKKESEQAALVAYIVTGNGLPPDRSALETYLQERLPAYMIPAVFIGINTLPLTFNGKLDLSKLPDPDLPGADSYVAPETELEAALVTIWETLLGTGQLGIHDNVFERGAHSILVIRFIAAVRKQLRKEVNIREVFTYPTVAALAARWEEPSEPLLSTVLPLPAPDRIPLSFSQERLWFIDQLQGSVQYHLPWVFRLTGQLDVPALEEAFRMLTDRHEILRTVILEEHGQPYQEIRSMDNWRLSVVDAAALSVSIEEYISDALLAPLNLAADYPLRVSLIQIAPDTYILAGMVHHIASDGWSVSIIVQELIALYHSITHKCPSGLAPLPVQYRDYAIWQRSHLSGEILKEKLSYWKAHLQGVVPMTLPTDYDRPANPGIRGGYVHHAVESGLLTSLYRLCREEKVTLYMLLLGALQTLLYRYTLEGDVCIGTSVAGRHQQEIEGLIGFFVNTMALRERLDDDPAFRALLQRVRQTVLDAYAHQEVPFEKVVDALDVKRDTGRNPLFQIIFVMPNTPPAQALTFENVRLEKVDIDVVTAQMDLVITAVPGEGENELMLNVVYNKSLYRHTTIARFLDHYVNLLEDIVTHTDHTLSQLQLIKPMDARALLDGFQQTPVADTESKTILDLFRRKVTAHPEAVAVQFNREEITYATLDRRSNQLARYLQKLGVRENVMVPVCLSRSASFVVAIWGILKAGGAYVPVDMTYPQERIAHILDDTNALLVITDSDHAHVCASARTVLLDNDAELISMMPETPVENSVAADDTAYIIYTSGSTGKPKGVMIPHRGLLASTLSRLQYYPQVHHVLLIPSFSFDSSVAVIFGTLANGGRLLVCTDDQIRNTEVLAQQLSIADTILCVPTYYRFLLEEQLVANSALRTVIVAGESLDRVLVQQHFRETNGVSLFNEYGPTEGTVWATVAAITSADNTVSIGHPIPGVKVYLLDTHLQPVPVGVPGELYISGEQVALGYRGLPALTAERFIPDLFNPGKRMYRTGDMGYWQEDGQIMFLGRNDEQIKINGHRIEPGEAEAVILRFPGIRQAAVVVQTDANGNKHLAAYIVAANAYNGEALPSFLREHLPRFMVPDSLNVMEALPLTPNGKIDRHYLQQLQAKGEQVNYIAPRNAVEAALAEIWQVLLEIDQVGIHDSFFALGGHSLLIIQLLARVRTGLGKELNIGHIFENPTIAMLMQRWDTLPDTVVSAGSIGKQLRTAKQPLSFAQESLWLTDRVQGSVQYHLPASFRLEGPLNSNALEWAFIQVIERHEILRTVIRDVNGVPYQEVLDVTGWSLPEVPLSGEACELLQEVAARPFDLLQEYPIRAVLAKETATIHHLFVIAHHIAFDGVSDGILLKELVAFYNEKVNGIPVSLPPLSIQYADFAIWQRKRLAEQIFEEQLKEWKRLLQDVMPLSLPTDHQRSSRVAIGGGIASSLLPAATFRRVQDYCRQQDVTPFMLFLSLYQVLLYRYTSQEDICVGSSVTNRQYAETADLIGYFVNTLAFRSRIDGAESFEQTLDKLKALSIQVFALQEVPFEKVVEVLDLPREAGRHPVFQVFFSLQLEEEQQESTDPHQLLISREVQEVITARFDLHIAIIQSAGGLRMNVIYRKDLFAPGTIQRLLQHYENLLDAVLTTPELSVAELPMLSDAERRWLGQEVNTAAVSYPGEQQLVSMFEAQVKRSPDATALVSGALQLSFNDLNKEANRLAAYLQYKGVKKGDHVIICMERSLDMVVAILAVLKAGAVYVPLEPGNPPARHQHIIQQTQAAAVITHSETLERLQHPGVNYVVTDEEATLIALCNEENPAGVLTPSDQACVIYTSGSTGIPKGVMVSHHNIVDYLFGLWKETSVQACRSFALVSSLSADLGNTIFFTSLLCGGTLHICSAALAADAYAMHQYFDQQRIDCVKIVPSHWKALSTNDRLLLPARMLIFGGELLRENMLPGIYQQAPGLVVVNHYGPTETTIGKLLHVCSPHTNYEGSVPLGKAFGNTQVLLLDRDRQLCPAGVPGELYVGGAGVTAGYLGDEEQTAARFVHVPGYPGRFYKTGDRMKYNTAGELIFLGRNDDQVKIRGFRVELTEIENHLNRAPGVKTAAMMAQTDKLEQPFLVAYMVAGVAFEKERVIAYLRERLPEYMIPAVLVVVDEIPLTSNGKTDRKRLPAINPGGGLAGDYEAPQDDMETVLAELWQEIFDVSRISVLDNFFELGGHSLLAISLATRIQSRLNIQLPVGALFDYPDVRSLAAHISSQYDQIIINN